MLILQFQSGSWRPVPVRGGWVSQGEGHNTGRGGEVQQREEPMDKDRQHPHETHVSMNQTVLRGYHIRWSYHDMALMQPDFNPKF